MAEVKETVTLDAERIHQWADNVRELLEEILAVLKRMNAQKPQREDPVNDYLREQAAVPLKAQPKPKPRSRR